VLTLPNRLEMVNALAASDARQDRTLFILSVLRDDNRNGLADRLFGGVAEDALRASIPGITTSLKTRSNWPGFSSSSFSADLASLASIV